MTEENNQIALSDSETESEEESLNSLDNIMKRGGRKPMTIRKQDCYVNKWNKFLGSEELKLVKIFINRNLK